MKAKDQFIEWLRDKILMNPTEPPAGAWEEIADGLDLEDSWAAISDDLDLDNVWQKLDTRLDHYNDILRFENISHRLSAAAVFLLLLGLFFQGPALDQDQDRQYAELEKVQLLPGLENSGYFGELSSKKESEAEAQDQLNPIPVQGRNDISGKQEERLDEQRQEPNIQQRQESLSLAAEVNAHKRAQRNRVEDTRGEPIFLTGKAFMEDSAYPNLQLDLSINRQTLVSGSEPVLEETRALDIYPNAYAGIGGAYKISGLLNSKTRHALERSSLLSSAPSRQQDIYLLYGHRIGRKLYLQAGFYLQDKAGQEYKEYREGTYGSFQDELSYRSAALSLSWLHKQVGFGEFPVFVRWTGGFYGGKLLSAEENSYAGSTAKTAEFKQFHAGMLAAYEYDVILHKNLMLSYGVSSRMDLLNIYSGTEDIPASFRKTRAASLGLTLSLKYLFKK